MFRTAIRPQWLALLGLALAFATAFAALGSWQLGRAREEPSSADPGIVATQRLQDVVDPQTSFTGDLVGLTIEVTGEFGPQTLRVEGRSLGGDRGGWALTPLVVRAGDGTATLPVVRGWVPDGVEAPEAPSGQVTLTGRLEPSEAPTGTVSGDEVSSVSSADLLNRWGQPIYTGYLVTDEPVPGGTLRAVPAVPVDDGGFALQNISYALQWWLFAAFAVFIWWRLVRDAHARKLEPLVENGSP